MYTREQVYAVVLDLYEKKLSCDLATIKSTLNSDSFVSERYIVEHLKSLQEIGYIRTSKRTGWYILPVTVNPVELMRLKQFEIAWEEDKKNQKVKRKKDRKLNF